MSKFFFILLLCLIVLTVNPQVLSSKFDTKNHPKAKGIWLTVRYPNGWEIKEGERPNIVKKFSGDYNGLFVVLALQIVDVKEPIENECKSTSARDFAEDLKTENQIITEIRKIKHEAKPAFIYDVRNEMERAGMSISMEHRVMSICYKSTLISAWCSPSKMDYAKREIISNSITLKTAEPLCFQFFNSVVLMDRY